LTRKNDISAANKEIAAALKDLGAVTPEVHTYWDEAEHSSVYVFSARDLPTQGVTTFATIGLSDHPLLDKSGTEFDTRVEFIGAARTSQRYFDNIISTAAFCVINSKWFCHPGAIFPDVVAMYLRDTALRHLTFAEPGMWRKPLTTRKFGDKTVSWLMMVPISEGEAKLVESGGIDRLENLFEEHDTDIFDLRRTPVA
jgi:antitoxin YqcF